MEIVTYGFGGKVWPNGQFGISRRREIPVGTSAVRPVGGKIAETLLDISVHGVLATLGYSRSSDEYYHPGLGLCSVPESEDISKAVAPTIGSSLRTKPHKRGTLGITTHGQKVVRCAAKLLQEQYGRDRLSFLTLTVPGMTSSNLALISDDWGRISKVFVQKLKRALLARGLSEEIVGVTEVQEKRLHSRGEFALHLHLLFQGALRPWQWEYSPRDYREMWFSVLESVVPRSEWTSDKGAEEVRSIKYSAEGYLGKYMSKGAKNLFIIKEKFPDVSLPSSWWMCTYRLRRKVLRSVCHVSHDAARYLVDLVETCPDLFDYLKVVRVSLGGRDVGVGWCGRIAPDRLDELRETLYALKEARLESVGGVFL